MTPLAFTQKKEQIPSSFSADDTFNYQNIRITLIIITFHFRDLFNDEDTRQVALDTYEQNKASCMSVAQKKLMKILKL